MKSSRKVAENIPASKRTKIDVAKKTSSNESTSDGKHFWKSGLTHALNNSKNIVESSDSFVIIKDKYPKVYLTCSCYFLLCPMTALFLNKDLILGQISLFSNAKRC
jgi:hypothetical protein